MNPGAITKAAKRLRQARAHLLQIQQFQVSPLAEVFEQEWYRFLVTIQSVPEALITGAKHNPRSRQWMGSKLKVIHEDPLLQYIFQSRAADYHGDNCLSVLRMSHGHYAEAIVDPIVETDEIARGVFNVPADVTRLSLWYEMRPAVDQKHGNVFPPPSEHLGESLIDRTAAGLAEKAIAFYTELLKEASQRPWSGNDRTGK